MHVSTTYCNTDKIVVEEKLYPSHGDWKKSIEIVENIDSHILDVCTHKILDLLPNTYVYSKSLSEHVVNDYCHGRIPVLIIRPSIVVSTLNDPFPGWIDNFNGPYGLMTASGKGMFFFCISKRIIKIEMIFLGILRTTLSDPNLVNDFIPVDVTIKKIIIGAWWKAHEKLVFSISN